MAGLSRSGQVKPVLAELLGGQQRARVDRCAMVTTLGEYDSAASPRGRNHGQTRRDGRVDGKR